MAPVAPRFAPKSRRRIKWEIIVCKANVDNKSGQNTGFFAPNRFFAAPGTDRKKKKPRILCAAAWYEPCMRESVLKSGRPQTEKGFNKSVYERLNITFSSRIHSLWHRA